MAESDNIGSLSVDVVAETQTAQEALEAFQGKLNTLAKDVVINVSMAKLEEVSQLLELTKRQIGELSESAGEKPVLRVEMAKKVTIEGDTKALDKALSEVFDKTYKIDVEIGNLDALKEQLGGLVIPITGKLTGVNIGEGVGAGLSVDIGSSGGGGQSQAREKLSQVLAGDTTGVNTHINDLYTRLNTALTDKGTPLRASDDVAGRLLAITERFGTRLIDPTYRDAKTKAELKERSQTGALNESALKDLGLTRLPAIMRSAAEVQINAIGTRSGSGAKISDISNRSLIEQALAAGTSSAPPVSVTMPAASSTGTADRTERTPVTAPTTAMQQFERLQREKFAIREAEAAKRAAEPIKLAPIRPVNLAEEVTRKLDDIKGNRTSATSTAPRTTTPTPAAAHAADLAKKEKFLAEQREKLEYEKANPPLAEDATPSKGHEERMTEWKAGITSIERSIANTESRIKTLNRGVPIAQSGLRRTVLGAEQGPGTNAEANAEAEARSAYTSTGRGGTLREGDVDLTDLLHLTNRGEFRNYGMVRTPGPVGGKPVEQLVELTPDQVNDERIKRAYNVVDGRDIRRMDQRQMLMDAAGTPEALALMEKSLAQEGENSPVNLALKGALHYPSSSTTSRFGDSSGGRPLMTTSSPSAASEAEDELWRKTLKDMRSRNPDEARAVSLMMQQEAGIQRDRISSETGDIELNRLFRAKNKSPMELMEKALVQRIGIETGQLIDPNVIVEAMDRTAESDRPVRNTMSFGMQGTGEFDSKGKEFQHSVATGFNPGSLLTELQHTVGAILTHPAYLEANPDNASLDTSLMSVKDLAGALRKTKVTVMSDYVDEATGETRQRGLPSNLGYLGDVVQALPQIAYQNTLVAGESSREGVFVGVGDDRLSDAARDGTPKATGTPSERRIQTPGQTSYESRRSKLAKLTAKESADREAARNAEIERTATRLTGMESVGLARFEAGDREPIGTLGKVDYVGTLGRIKEKSPRSRIDQRIRTAEKAVEDRYATERAALEAELEAGRSEAPGVTYLDDRTRRLGKDQPDLVERGKAVDLEAQRNTRMLMNPATEAALSFIAQESGAEFKIQADTPMPKARGRKAETAAIKAAASHFTGVSLQPPVVPEGAPTGKALLESDSFKALSQDIQDEVRSLIEIKEGDRVTGYRGISQIGQPPTKPGQEIYTTEQRRKAFEGAYPAEMAGNRVVNTALSGQEIVAQIMESLSRRGPASETPSSEATLYGRGGAAADDVDAEPTMRERIAEGSGVGLAGTLSVNVMNWPEAMISGGGGGGGGTPPAPPAGGGGEEPPEGGEPVTPGKPLKNLKLRRPMGVAHSPQERAVLDRDYGTDPRRKAEVAQEQMYSGMLIKVDEAAKKDESRTAAAAVAKEKASERSSRDLLGQEEMYGRMLIDVDEGKAKFGARHSDTETRQRHVDESMERFRRQQAGSVAPESERQRVYEGLFDQADARDNYVRYTEPTGQSYYGPQGPSPRAQRARMAEAKRSIRSGRSAQIFAGYEDEAQDEFAPIRAELRKANRSVPKRGFGASITDVATSFFDRGALEHQLEYLDRAQEEATQLKVSSRRMSTLKTQRSSALEQARALPVGDARRAGLLETAREVGKEMKDLAPTIKESEKRLRTFTGEVTKGSTVVKSFAAAAGGSVISTALGSITMGLGMAVTGPLIQAVGSGMSVAMDTVLQRVLSHPAAAAKVIGQGDQAVMAGKGNMDVATATFAQSLNLSAPQSDLISGPIMKQSEIEQGNKNLAAMGDALRTVARLDEQGFKGIGTGTSGSLGTMFDQVPGTAQIVGGLFENDPGAEPNKYLTAQQEKLNDLLTDGMGFDDTLTSLMPFRPQYQAVGKPEGERLLNPEWAKWDSQTRTVARNVDFLNEGLSRTGDGLYKFVDGTDKITSWGLKQEDLQLQAGIVSGMGADAAPLAEAIAKGVIAIVGPDNKVTTDPAALEQTLTDLAIGTNKSDLPTMLDKNKYQVMNQFWQEEQQGQMARGEGRYKGQGLIQSQFGIAMAASPIGSATSTTAKQDRKSADLKETKKLYAEINKDAEEGITQAKSFVSTWLDGSPAVGTFNTALNAVVKTGKDISKIEIGREMVHAEYAAKQYNFQIYQANRSLRDARNLVKAINGEGGSGLGGIQGQQFMLQRQSQSLTMGMTQKQINLQKALAGFVTPGDTPEERAARIKQAKLEADYAQKQLDIQKKLFGLEGKGFKITAGRSVIDLTRQLGLLEQGRQITIDDAAAQKKLRGLNIRMQKEMKIVNNIFDQAQTRANDMLSLTGKFANAIEKDAAKVFRDITTYYLDFYRRMTNLATGSNDNPKGGTGDNRLAAGFLGNVSGETTMTVGEAGTETVAVLRNPRNVSPGGTGGGQVVNIYVTGNTIRGEDDIDSLVYKIERKMNQKAAMLGYRKPV